MVVPPLALATHSPLLCPHFFTPGGSRSDTPPALLDYTANSTVESKLQLYTPLGYNRYPSLQMVVHFQEAPLGLTTSLSSLVNQSPFSSPWEIITCK